MSIAIRYGRAIVVATLLSALFSLSCSKEGEAGSCYRPHDNACAAYSRSASAAGKRMCAGMKWSVGEASCPAEGLLGTCTKKDGVESLYAGAPNNYTPASAKRSCESGGGDFKPAPPSP